VGNLHLRLHLNPPLSTFDDEDEDDDEEEDFLRKSVRKKREPPRFSYGTAQIP
jgi:hypothetical protein